MLQILSWNCWGFPWNKGPKISWISNDLDIIFLVETWEHEESEVPNKMALHYGLPGTSDPSIEALGAYLATLRRTSPPMLEFIKTTIATNIVGLRLLTLMIKIPT